MPLTISIRLSEEEISAWRHYVPVTVPFEDCYRQMSPAALIRRDFETACRTNSSSGGADTRGVHE